MHPPAGSSWPGEDRAPTTQRERYGFYSYSIAAEVFAVVGVGAFLPVTLEQLARENGVLYSDKSTPCTAPQAPQASTMHMIRATDGTRDPDQCIVHLFGSDITTASFAMYTFSVAVFCQALTLVSVSAFADYGGNRKRLLLMFGTVGALASMSFMFVVPAIYLAGALLAIVGITSLGSSFTIFNSFLPLLAANDPSVQQHQKESSRTERGSDHSSVSAAVLEASTSISSNAVGLGYAAAILVQIVAIGILALTQKLFGDSISSTLPLRLILLLAGTWWLIFMIPTAFWLRERPGPALSEASLSYGHGRVRLMLAHIRFAWVAVFRTIKIAAQLRDMSIFLIAWFLLSDAHASIEGTAILFARTELKIGTIGIAMISITVMISGVLGATLIPIISRRMHWSNPQTIMCCLVMMEFVPLYGLLGYLPFIRSWGIGGLQQWWEIYPCALVFGIVMAGLSSFCRACFGQLIPPGNEAAFFALFAITDKGSSAIGPAVVGRIVDVTGHIRPAFWFLAVLVAMPVPLIWGVDMLRGREAAIRMARRLAERERVSVPLEVMHEGEEAEGLMREHE